MVGACTVGEEDEVMLITSGGTLIRTRVNEISTVGRNTQGVKLINLEPNDKLQAIAPVISEEKGDTDEGLVVN